MKIMRSIIVVLAAAALQLGNATKESSNGKVTPVQKVIQLMEGMKAKGQKEKHDEQVQFAAYKQFCDDTSREKEQAIEEAEEKMATLKADIMKADANAKKLTKEIAELDEDISVWTGDEKAATKVREIEAEDNHKKMEDLEESVDALERAIMTLKKRDRDVAQAEDDDGEEALVQLSALKKMKLMPDENKKFVDAFLQASQEFKLRLKGEDSEQVAEQAAPEANAYEFQSSGVIEMLEKLHDKFVAELDALQKEEANSKHAYDMLMQDLGNQIEEATSDRESRAEAKAKNLEAKAKALGDLHDTKELHDSDQKYLSDLTATCTQKASDFEARQQLRAEEIEAIEKAIEIISSGAVAGNAEKHLPGGFLQVHKSASLAQLRTNMHKQELVLKYLKSKALKLNSRLLSALTVRIAEDPFMKVKKMIKELIVKLMEEANEEAEHKGWCDKELATNEKTRTEKTEEVETLHADIDELEASQAKLKEEIVELSKAIAELDDAMAKATAMRQEEKAKNGETIEDSMEAQAAVEQAMSVLKEFYAKAGEATAFIQQEPEAPEIFDEAYKGMGAENGGVVGMLEVIMSDFARLESETKAAEANSQKEYDSFMSDSKVDKAEKTSMVEHKTSKEQDQSEALQHKKKDLVGAQKELDAALAYYDKLKPSCVDSGVSYEDRVARRKEEIESLQESLKILSGEDIA